MSSLDLALLAMARYREPNVAQLRFVPINFTELFPEDHPLSQLLSTIRQLDLSEFDASYKNDSPAGGRPADSCERVLAVMVYSLLYGGISMRNVQRELSVRADLLYLSGGMSIDNTTFSIFRADIAKTVAEGVHCAHRASAAPRARHGRMCGSRLRRCPG